MKLISMAFVILWGTIGAAKGEFVPSSEAPKVEDSKAEPAKRKYSDAEVVDFLQHLKKVRPDLYEPLNARWEKELKERKKSSSLKFKKEDNKASQGLRRPASQTTQIETH